MADAAKSAISTGRCPFAAVAAFDDTPVGNPPLDVAAPGQPDVSTGGGSARPRQAESKDGVDDDDDSNFGKQGSHSGDDEGVDDADDDDNDNNDDVDSDDVAWKGALQRKRLKHMPKLEETGGLLASDGGPCRLGTAFYDQLAKLAPEVYKLFDGKSVDYQALRLGEIVLELIRLVSLPTQKQFMQSMESLAMRHVDYGADRKHGQMFKKCLLIAIRTFVIREGGVWNSHHANAWSWVYNVAFAALFDVKDEVQPKVEAVRSSFERMLHNAMQKPATKSGGGKKAHGLTSKTSSSSSEGLDGQDSASECKPKVPKSKRDALVAAGSFQAPGERSSAMDPTVVALTVVGDMFLELFLQELPLKGKGFHFSDEFPLSIGRILKLIVESATRPFQLQNKLRSMATRHVELGVAPSHLKCFGAALFRLLPSEIGVDAWTSVQDSWTWLWTIVEDTFNSILEHWKHTVKYVNQSWGKLMKSTTSEAVAFIFFTSLMEQGTREIQEKFKRPVAAQAKMFGKALELIVGATKSNIDDSVLNDIALRHIKFELKPRMFDTFGKILLKSLKEQIQDDWCPELEGAWANLFDTVAQILISLLDQSENLMRRGFAKQTSLDVKKALDASPRKARSKMALVFDDEDNTCPLLCAIRDGYTDIARLLIDDITCIRADTETYYFGLQELWTRCDDIITAMCVHAPSLITPLLDGHVWVSPSTVRGRRQVNFWHKHIYGDPDVVTDVFEGPLGDLVDKVPISHLHVFTHPVIMSVVGLKWRYFAKPRLIILNVMQALNLFLFELFVRTHKNAKLRALRGVLLYSWLACSSLLLGYTLLLIVCQAWYKQFSTVALGSMKIHLPRILCDFFPWSRLFYTTSGIVKASWYIATAGAMDIHGEPVFSAIFHSVLWIQLFEAFRLSEELSSILFMASKLFANIVRFLGLLVVWIEATGVAVYYLAPQQLWDCTSYENTPYNCNTNVFGGKGLDIAYTIFVSTLGHESEVMFYAGPEAWLVRIVFTTAIWVGVVPILNLLVASMVSTFAESHMHTRELAVRARAGLALSVESILGTSQRRKYFDKIGFDKPLPFSNYDYGPSGGVTEEISSLQLETNRCYLKALDRVQRFAGSTDENDPWPDHDAVNSAAQDMSDSLMALDTSINGLTKKCHADMTSVCGDFAELKHLVNEALGATSQASVDLGDTTTATSDIGVDDDQGTSKPQVYTTWSALKEAAASAGSGSCILAVEGIVYDAGSFVAKHPGGPELIKKCKGTDATADFQRHANVTRAYQMLLKLPRIGEVTHAE